MGTLGTKNATSTATEAPPSWVTSGYKELFKDADYLGNKSYTPYTGGFTADQQSAFKNIRSLWNAGQPYFGAAKTAATNALTPTYKTVGNYMNPYVENVIKATQANIQESNARQQQDVLGNAAARGALGGNRVGVAQAELARQQDLASNQTIAGLWNDAYGQALNAAQQQQQTGLAGAGVLGNLGQTSVNTNLAQTAAQLGAGTQQQQFDYQQYLNKLAFPYQQRSWQAGIYGGIGPNAGGITTQSIPQGNLISQIIGGIIGGASLFKDGGRVHAAGGGVMPYRNDAQEWPAAMFDVSPYANDNSDTQWMSYIPEAGETNYTRASYPSIQDWEQDDPFALGKQGAQGVAGFGRLFDLGDDTIGTNPFNVASHNPALFKDGGVVRTAMLTEGRPKSNNIEDRRPGGGHDPIGDLVEQILDSLSGNDNEPLPPIPQRRRANSPYFPSEFEPLSPYRDPAMPGETFSARASGGVVPMRGYAPGGIVPDDQYSYWRNAHAVIPALPTPPPLETAASTRAGAVGAYGIPPVQRVVQTVPVTASGVKPSTMFNSGANNLGVQGTKHPRGYVIPADNSNNEPWPGEYNQTVIGRSTRPADIITNNPVKLIQGPVAAQDVVLDQDNLGLTQTGERRKPVEVTVGRSWNDGWFGRLPKSWLKTAAPTAIGDLVWEDVPPSSGGIVNEDVWARDRVPASILDGTAPKQGLVTGSRMGVIQAPTTFKGANTGRTFQIGQTYTGSQGRKFVATPDGKFKQQGQTEIKHSFAPVKSAGERYDTLGNDMAFAPLSVQTSDRWNTGYAEGGVVRRGYAPGGVIGDVPYSTGDQFVTEPTPGYSQNIGDAFRSLQEGNGLNLSPDMREALLAAGAGMMSSRSPFALQGIGEGTLKGVEAWHKRQEMERQNAEARANIANTTKTSDASAALMKAQVPLTEAQTLQQRYIANRTPLGMYVFDLMNPEAGPKLYRVGQVGPDGQPVQPLGPEDNGGFEPLFYEPGQSTPGVAQTDYDPRLVVQEAVPMVYGESARVIENAEKQYDAATAQKQQLTEMRHALDKLPKDGFLMPGTNFDQRLSFAKGVNTAAQMIGLNPLISEEEVAAGEEITKIANRLGAELTNTFPSSGAASIFETAIASVPSGMNSPEGAQIILNNLEAFGQRAIDYKEFINDWVRDPRNAGSTLGADVAFNRAYPPELYAISAYIPAEALRRLQEHPEYADWFNFTFGHGRDVAQYVLRASRP